MPCGAGVLINHARITNGHVIVPTEIQARTEEFKFTHRHFHHNSTRSPFTATKHALESGSEPDSGITRGRIYLRKTPS